MIYSNQHVRFFSSILLCQNSYHSTVNSYFEEEFIQIKQTIIIPACVHVIHLKYRTLSHPYHLNYSLVVAVVIKATKTTINIILMPETGLSDLHILCQLICISTVCINILLLLFCWCENWDMSRDSITYKGRPTDKWKNPYWNCDLSGY